MNRFLPTFTSTLIALGVLASLGLPSVAVACETGSDNPPAAKTKKR